jgi:glycosyltransferase involved in cell wall biosynthesis
MKVLFVLDQLPFPARNGITFTTSNHIKILSRHHDISLLYIVNGPELIDQSYYNQTKNFVSDIHVAIRKKNGRITSMLKELFLFKPIFSSYAITLPDSLGGDYDAIWGCPVGMCETIFSLKKQSEYKNTKTFLSVNEPYSLTLNKRDQISNHGIIVHSILRFVTIVRSMLMAIHEKKIYQKIDRIVVQSNHEIDWIENRLSPELAKKATSIPNGVDESLLVAACPNNTKMLFVGDLSIEYFHKMVWFLDNIWAPVVQAVPTATLDIVGGSASQELIDIFKKSKVNYLGFVDDLRTVFESHGVVVAPIYKGGGIISKVIEAMASGCLVVGDETAFSGIDGFVDDVHGMIAKDKEHFISILVSLLKENKEANEIGLEARSLMAKSFQWKSRHDLLEDVLKS